MIIAAGPGWGTTALPLKISHVDGITAAVTLLDAAANELH
jgi:hypothetical protein